MSEKRNFFRVFHVSLGSENSSRDFFQVVKVHDGAVDLEEAGMRLVVDQDQIHGGVNAKHDERCT